MKTLLAYMGVAGLSYLIGSVNCGVTISCLFFRDDVRKHGSHNAGATNMLRVYGKPAALFTFLGDLLKGTGAVLLAKALASLLQLPPDHLGAIAGLAAMMGHMYPAFFQFKGGKGVSTAFGALAALHPLILLVLVAIGLPLILVSGYVSLGSVVGAALYPFVLLFVMLQNGRIDELSLLLSVLTAGFIASRHKENLQRLRDGTENKIFSKKKG